MADSDIAHDRHGARSSDEAVHTGVPSPPPSVSLFLEAGLAAAVVALGYLLLRTSPVLAAGAFSDDGVYLALGKAIASGEGYHSIYTAGAPVHLKYPPGLPAFYALLWWMGRGLDTVHALALGASLLASAVAAGLLWWLARARFGLTRLSTGLFVLSPFFLEGLVQYLNLATSEAPFLLSWVIALVLFGRLHRAGTPRSRMGWALGLGLTVAAATLIRTQGVVLVPALLVALLIVRAGSRPVALFSLSALLPLVCWSLWHRLSVAAGPVSTQPDEEAYSDWLGAGGGSELLHTTLDVLRSQVTRYVVALPSHFAEPPVLGGAILAALVLLAVVGGARRLRSDPDVVLSGAALSVVIALWPFSQDRFVLILLPVFGLLAAAAVQRWAQPTVHRGRWGYGLAAVLILLVGVRQMEIRSMRFGERAEGELYFHPAQFLVDNTRYLVAASRWVAERAGTEDVLLAPLPAGIWLYTGVPGVNATPAEPDVGPSDFDVPGAFLAHRIAEDGVTLLLLWNPNFEINRDAALVQRTCPDALQFLEVTREPAGVAIFRINATDPCLSTEFLDPLTRVPR
ncbi:MAG: glycosyltransferase family 39 protein [Gemmatimonadota bacterium]